MPSTTIPQAPARSSGPLTGQWGVPAAFAALIVVCFLPTPQGLPVAGQYMLGMLLFSVIL